MNKLFKSLLINNKSICLNNNNLFKQIFNNNSNKFVYRTFSTDNNGNLTSKQLKEKIIEKENEEIREFIKTQALSSTARKMAAPKEKMNRRERRQMTTKLYRNPDNLIRGGIVSPKPLIPSHIKKPPYANGVEVIDMEIYDPIEIHTKESIEHMRVVCKMAKEVLEYAGTLVKPGITTDEIDKLVHAEIIRRGAYPSPLDYKGFPKSICTSVNEIICHGIPDDRPLENGDIINIDITCYYNGYHGDTSATFPVGEIDVAAQRLIEAAEKAMYAGIEQVKPGALFNKIGKEIQLVTNKYSLSLPPEFTGHGIGQTFHAPPFVFQCVNDLDFVMEEGMIFTIEPIVVESTNPYTEWKLWDDEWTISSKEGGWSAQFEHTVLVTKTGYEILTK